MNCRPPRGIRRNRKIERPNLAAVGALLFCGPLFGDKITEGGLEKRYDESTKKKHKEDIP